MFQSRSQMLDKVESDKRASLLQRSVREVYVLGPWREIFTLSCQIKVGWLSKKLKQLELKSRSVLAELNSTRFEISFGRKSNDKK